MTKSILIQHFTSDQLQENFNDLHKRIDSLNHLLSERTINEELLTREQTCKFLKIDSSTLWSWTNKGKVRAYGIGNRRYYKKEELMACLTALKK